MKFFSRHKPSLGGSLGSSSLTDLHAEKRGLLLKSSRDDQSPEDVMRMIGDLAATASENWPLVLEVCKSATLSESHAKEAMRALQHEFKYGEPPAQLYAARLWATILYNTSGVFMTQCSSPKFLKTLEDLIRNTNTPSVVRNEILKVVAAAAFSTDSDNNEEGFKGLWRRVKASNEPEEGMPLDQDVLIIKPQTRTSGHRSRHQNPLTQGQTPPSRAVQSENNTFTARHSTVGTSTAADVNNQSRLQTSSTHKMQQPSIYVDDRVNKARQNDMRRLFHECSIAQDNASLLSQALILCKPEDLEKRGFIKEFHSKCRSSLELISALIHLASIGTKPPQAKAGHRDRVKADHGRTQATSEASRTGKAGARDRELTIEQRLLHELLQADKELVKALRQYDDLARAAWEQNENLLPLPPLPGPSIVMPYQLSPPM